MPSLYYAFDNNGRILAQADPVPGEKISVAPVDIEILRRFGHDMRAHMHTDSTTCRSISHQSVGVSAA